MIVWMIREQMHVDSPKQVDYYRVRWDGDKFIPERYSKTEGTWRTFTAKLRPQFYDSVHDTLVAEIDEWETEDDNLGE